MKIIAAGASGYLGRPLASALAERGYEVVILTRGAPAAEGRVRLAPWDPDGSAGPSGGWAREIDGADAIINLAGAGIADKRWSAARKRVVRASRVLSTRSLVAAVRGAGHRPATFVQGSAVGFYGTNHPNALDESYPPGDDFLADVAVAWEAEAQPVAALGCRLVIIRSGVALSRDGGALKKMLPPFKLFVGGPIGDGRQYFSWIHRDDWIALLIWAIENPQINGVLNGSAPEPVTNREFSAAVGRALGRPSWLPVPAFALRAAFGEMGQKMLIEGQRVIPKRTQELGFAFTFPTIDKALEDVLRT